MSFTTDLTTPIGQTRWYLRDTDRQNPIWADPEVTFALQESGGIPRLAAAICLEAECTDRARNASIIRLGAFGDNEAVVYQAMSDQATKLRAGIVVGPSVTDLVEAFTYTSFDGSRLGDMENW